MKIRVAYGNSLLSARPPRESRSKTRSAPPMHHLQDPLPGGAVAELFHPFRQGPRVPEPLELRRG